MAKHDIDQFVTVAEAAEIIGCSDAHVRYMLIRGSLPGRKFSNSWMILREDAVKMGSVEHVRGRPRKHSSKTA